MSPLAQVILLMIGIMRENTIAAAMLIAVTAVGLGAAPAQETWGAAGASAGSSRSSSAQSAGHASGADSLAGSSSWTAGKESFPYAVQRGGIWRDKAELAGSSAPSPGGSASGMHLSGGPLRPVGLSPAPSAGSATVHGNTQRAPTSGGHRSLGGPRAGIAKSSHGGPSRPAGVKFSAIGSRSRSGSQGSGLTGYSAQKGSASNSKASGTNQSK